jgi:hypothetical protein
MALRKNPHPEEPAIAGVSKDARNAVRGKIMPLCRDTSDYPEPAAYGLWLMKISVVHGSGMASLGAMPLW